MVWIYHILINRGEGGVVDVGDVVTPPPHDHVYLLHVYNKIA